MRMYDLCGIVRIAIVTVCVCWGGAGSVAWSEPISLSTPAGLNAGDTFRFLFVTAGTTTATSSDIATYNTFVQAQAGNATYNGVTVTWKAIGSTSSVSARDNVGGFGTPVAVYRPGGAKLADDMTANVNGLWSGTLLATPSERIDGSSVTEYPWTGSKLDGGIPSLGSYLGDLFGVYAGNTSAANLWITASNGNYYGSPRPMYGLSEELTASGGSPVPEIDPAGMGSVLALVSGVLGLLERRRRQTA